jgi:3-deoxy-D-manno-octulosonate 8-phosphate phosphatase KdsC-like HAD superfamily phosphatase
MLDAVSAEGERRLERTRGVSLPGRADAARFRGARVQKSKGCKDEAAALGAFAARQGLTLEQICFMGDDGSDWAAMEIVGVSATPVSAHVAAWAKADYVTIASGGHGAVLELVDRILEGTVMRSCRGTKRT